MADAEARREARRRKILQNSESRLNRLLGKADGTDEASVSTTSGDVPAQSLPESRDFPSETSTTTTTTSSSSRLTSSEPEPEEVTHTAVGDTTQTVPESQTPPRSVHQRAVPREKERENSGGQREKSGQDVLFQSNTPSLEAKQPNADRRNGVPETSGAESVSGGQADPLKLLDLIRCGGCLLVAFLTRWALHFGLGLLFLELVMIPFLLLEGSLLYFQTTHMKDLKLPHSSSMMKYVLVFSGVRQDLIVKYGTIMGYVTAASEDFALFLFVFLACNAVIA
ncbi:hypothetical protein ACOMHN_001378 [Nucella lapillus]